MNTLGFGQEVGQIVQIAYVVQDIRAAINWRASVDWDGRDPIRPFG